jgi:hypothetical protein
MDFFNDQEYINPQEFTAKTKKFAYKMFRDIKRDIDVFIYESPTGLDKYLGEAAQKLDLSNIVWHVNRQVRRIGFTDKGAFSGLFQEGGLIYEEATDRYFYREGDYDIEHCRPIQVIALRLVWGYLNNTWDCDESGNPIKGLTFLQETVFKGIATIKVLGDSHKYITEATADYLSDKGLDEVNFLVTMREHPDRMQKVWNWFDEGRHYEKVGIKFYPSSKMTILPFQKRVVPQHDKPHIGLVGNYQRFMSKTIRKVRPKPYIKKKDRVKEVKHDFF